MTEWDTFGLFQSLLDKFSERLAEAALLDPAGKEFDLNVNLAIVGFSQFQPANGWSDKQCQIIRSRLDGDLADLDWFDDCAKAIRLFACLGLGAMLGKFAAGEIDDVGFLLGDAHLAGFNALNDEQICEQWHLASKASG